MQWLRNLLAPCFHRWEPWRERNLHRVVDNRIVGSEVIHRCAKCGLTRTERML